VRKFSGTEAEERAGALGAVRLLVDDGVFLEQAAQTTSRSEHLT
jgi:hypothetical protein